MNNLSKGSQVMSTALPDNWLDLAAAHGATQWVKRFIKAYLPQLHSGAIAPQQFALSFAAELESRGLTTLAQQKNYRSNVVQALKVIDENHPAIALVSPTTEEYRVLNEMQRGRLAKRETQYFTSDQAEALVNRAIALLDSAEWSEVAAGLAVLVGRRISELLLSEFSLRSAWSLAFSEMAKKQGATGLTIEIPTLAPAEVVLGAIERLQKALRVEDLKLNSLSPKMAKQRVNGRYSEAVAARCVEHFSNLVPARSGREDLYTHVFRAVYATIAAHWFCPPHIPEHNFKAEIQGHFTLAQDGRKLPNYSARANYDDYAIGTTDGNRDGRLGIKLGRLPELEVIEAFRKPQETTMATRKIPVQLVEQAQSELEALFKTKNREGDRADDHPERASDLADLDRGDHPEAAQPKPKMRRLNLRAEDVDAMLCLMAKRGVSGTEREVFQAFVETFKTDEAGVQQQQAQTVQELTASLNWFVARIDALEERCAQLQQERDRLLEQQPRAEELGRLQQENAQLRQELQQTQSRLEGIQKLLGGANGAVAPAQTAAQPQIAPAQATAVEQPSRTARRGRGEADEKLGQIVDALIAWNTAQEGPDSQLRISIPTIKALANLMGANYQPAIQQVLKERAGELEELHQRLMLGTRHNARIFKKEEILQAIARDYLGLDNWQEVRYAG
ncbi:protelomerase family protein [Thermoleptolyngbya sp.]